MRFVLRNLAGIYMVYALSIVSGLVLTPVIIHSIGKTAFGVWAFIGSLAVFLRVLDLGLAPTIVRHSAYLRGRDEPERVNELASSGLFLYLAIGCATTACGLALAWLLPSLVSIHGSLVGPARIAALVTVVSLALELPLGMFSALLKGSQRFDVINAGAVVSLAVYALLVALVLTRSSSVVTLAAIALSATIIRVTVPVLFVRRELPRLRLSRRLVSRTGIRDLLSFSGYTFAGHIAAKIVFASDAIVIGVVLGAPAVAFYAVASRLFNVALGLSSSGTDLFFPALSESEGRADRERQKLYLLAALRASTCAVVLVTGPLIALPGWVIRGWLGGGFGSSVSPLVLLALTLFFTQPTTVMAQYLLGRGRPRALAVIQVSFGLANLAFTAILLVTVGKLWVAPVATLVLEAIVSVVALPLVLAGEGLSYRTLAAAWTRAVSAGIAPACVTLLPAAVLWHGSASLPGVLAVGFAWAVAFGPAAWFIGLGEPERAGIRRGLRRLRPPTRAPATP